MPIDRRSLSLCIVGKHRNDLAADEAFAADARQHTEVEALLRRLSSAKADMAGIHVYYSELSGTPHKSIPLKLAKA